MKNIDVFFAKFETFFQNAAICQFSIFSKNPNSLYAKCYLAERLFWFFFISGTLTSLTTAAV